MATGILDAFTFAHAEEGALFAALLDGAEAFCRGWRHRPFAVGGNFVTARWACGAGAREDCLIAQGSAHRRDQRVVELSTLFYPRAPQEAFGVNLSLLVVPPGAGWGLNFSLHVGGRSVMGEGLQASFRRYGSGAGGPEESLVITPRPVMTLFESTFSVPCTGSLVEELRGWIASPDVLLRRSLAAWTELERRVLEALDAGRVETADEGPYLGDGLPPERVPRALRPDEGAEARRDLAAEMTRRRRLLEAESSRFHGMLCASFPFGEILSPRDGRGTP